MKSHRTRRRHWTMTKVRTILPYVRSLLFAIRESALEIQFRNIRVQKIRSLCGSKPEMKTLILLRDLQEEISRHDTALQANLDELQKVGVFCYHQIQAIAIFYFSNCASNNCNCVPSWFVYSPFGDELFWRLEGDDLKTKRGIEEINKRCL